MTHLSFTVIVIVFIIIIVFHYYYYILPLLLLLLLYSLLALEAWWKLQKTKPEMAIHRQQSWPRSQAAGGLNTLF